jgi:hypothetical protein
METELGIAKYANCIECFKDIWMREGIAGFYKVLCTDKYTKQPVLI